MLDMLLEYSMPFCNTPYNNKLLKINFNYADGKSTNIDGMKSLSIYKSKRIVEL